MAKLTTTSYAILGLLALRPWTTYELAEQMRRALGHFWPRAESGIYEEPKKLVAHGFARADNERVGRRPRTRYTITAKGRAALRSWVASPGEGPVVEFEQLVKVFFAEHGDREALLGTLRDVESSVVDRAASFASIPREYLEGRGSYPERLPWLILTGRFLDEIEQAVVRWVTWAIATVESWPEDIRAADPDWETLEDMARHADALADRAAVDHTAAADAADTRAQIRPLRDGDIEAIVGLSLRAWAPVFQSMESTMGAAISRRLFGPDWREHQAADVRRACATHQVSVAEVEGTVVGFTAVDVGAEGEHGEIYMLAVDPAHQGRGIGSQLTRHAVEAIRASGKKMAVVGTGGDPGHAPARATYRKAGFTRLPTEQYYLLL